MDTISRALIDYTIAKEGGYSNDPNDAGGETNLGISRRSYPNVDIKNLTKDVAAEIYYRDYLIIPNILVIPTLRLRWKVFDIAVNMGAIRAVKMLQEAVAVNQDGVLGKATLEAIEKIDETFIIFRLVHLQMKHYVKRVIKVVPSDLVYLQGWTERAFDNGDNLMTQVFG